MHELCLRWEAFIPVPQYRTDPGQEVVGLPELGNAFALTDVAGCRRDDGGGIASRSTVGQDTSVSSLGSRINRNLSWETGSGRANT